MQPVPEYRSLFIGWMDFNLDGDWDDAGEQVISQTNAAIGINNFTVPILQGAVAGHTLFTCPFM